MTYSENLTLPDGQKAVLHHELGVTMANAKSVILALHGHAADWSQGSQGAMMDSGGHLLAASRAGHAVLSIDAGGPADWGGPTSMTKIDAAVTYSGRTKVGLDPFSMNLLAALNYIKRNPTKVYACWAWEGVSDLAWVNTSFTGGAAEIIAAYGSYAASVGYRVADELATWRGLGIPIELVHASDDSVVPYSQALAFVAGVSDPLVTLRSPTPTGDHLGVFPNVPKVEMVAFFDRYAP